MMSFAAEGRIDTWDYQWTLMQLLKSGLAIVPGINLVSNVGFDRDATHTSNRFAGGGSVPAAPISFPLKHPSEVMPARQYDDDYLLWQAGRPRLKYVLQQAERHYADREFARAVLLLEAAAFAQLVGNQGEQSQLHFQRARVLRAMGQHERAEVAKTEAERHLPWHEPDDAVWETDPACSLVEGKHA